MSLLKFVLDLFQAHKMKKAMNEESTGTSCTACDSTKVQVFAPAAYRCLDCGYEGGDGYAAYKQGQKAARFDQLSPEQRHAKAHEKLLAAQRLLLSGIGDAEHAKTLSGLDIMGIGSQAYGGSSGEGNEKQLVVTAAVGLMLEAKNDMSDAQLLMGTPIFQHVIAGDMGGGSMELASADLYLDSLFTDLLAHGRIVEVVERAKSMKDAVDQVLAQHFSR